MPTDRELAEVLRDFARTMVTDFPIQAILDRLVQQIVQIMPVTAAGVTLISAGLRPRYVAASDPSALRYEQLQTDLAEGPCLLAFNTGEAVSVPDLAVDTRFATFQAQALAHGLGAVWTFPLRQGETCLGALDLYRESPGVLDDDAMTVAQTLADVTTAYLVNAQARADLEALSALSQHNALHDALTGLPNRTLLLERLDHVLRNSGRSASTVAVLYIDLDHFKNVNDEYGHRSGDELLIALASRVSALLRLGDTLARMSGDEFVVVCEGLDQEREAEEIAARIVACLATSFTVSGAEITISASVGIAYAGPRSDLDAERLLHLADVAMYQAKREGGHRHHVINLRDDEVDHERHSLAVDLAGAVRRDELHLEYQPIVSCFDGRLVGAEALLRWHHATRGVISPGVAIPLAEASGLMGDIGRWVLETAYVDSTRWGRMPGGQNLWVSVNVSALQLMDPQFAAMVASVLKRTKTDPARLTLEITEGVFLHDSGRAAVVLADLRKLGLRIALDDFGTGHSPLTYLQVLPVDALKIDQSFVSNCTHDAPSRGIITKVIELAHLLELTVVAEGVETAEQHAVLCTLGSEYCQGFYFAKPMPAAAFEALLQHPEPAWVFPETPYLGSEDGVMDKRPSSKRYPAELKGGGSVATENGRVLGDSMDVGDSQGHTHEERRDDDLNRLRGEALFARSRSAVVDIDPAGEIMAFSPAAERLFGCRAGDVVGGPVGVLVPDRSAEEVAGIVAELAGRRDAEPYTINLRRPNGEVLELSMGAVSLTRSDGSGAGLSVILQDLSTLHRAQAALAASEARYRTMIESAHEGVAVLDAEHRLTFVNARLAEMFGYSVDEMNGSSMFAGIFPEDAGGAAEMMERRRTGLSEDTENRWRRKDGSTLWTMKATAPLFDEAGAYTGSVSFLTDVTDQKRAEAALRASEARLRAYFEYAPVGIVLASRDDLVVDANPAVSSITGYGADELVGSALSLLVAPDQPTRAEEIEGHMRALLSGELPLVGFEQPFVAKDGRSLWLEVTVSLMRDEQGKPLEFVAVLQDVTERKDAERVKDEFVSVTSHELRTPLTSIRGALGLLAGGVVGDLPDSAQRMLDVAVQSTDRLIRLINDILDLERLNSGTLSLLLEACDAADLVSRAIEEIRGAADALGVEVRAASVEGRVWADPDRIIQTLTNVVGNAIKFSPRSSTVEVSAKVEGDHVRFVVEDHGPGIPADQLETVFERFRQVDASDSRAKGGTGLGLAICRTIVEQHSGRIWAESVLGEGTIFSFTLPVVADIEEENPDDCVEPGVLVCDDDASIREVVKTMLEASGFRVWTAASGEEALAVARARQPDVIVLDLLLPGIGGRETADALKGLEETADIPVVVLSVLSAEQTVVEGAASRVGKPIEEDMLLTALRHALGGDHRQALVVEDDPQLAEVIEVTLARHGLNVRRAQTGREAIRLGRALIPDLLMLDLALLGGDGYSVVEWMRSQHWLRTVPVLVYTAFDLEDADRSRLRLGETKFLTKGRTPPALFEAKLEELLDWMAQEASPR